ncbi:MAG: cysteine--tRNA ligase [Candidatus Paraimprobicoccus trichonymphae]|uniref:Cysteine--tRNA ligase n=1 Tax=Candidatus Paraimprobicoccus trichonymphae TaxID=3033793 RepID=A0AA48ICF7_9FIRM|nr:MAG: cysteine--tRNA ligase [Candidatus Paraimprobicoccus trichonymphae]
MYLYNTLSQKKEKFVPIENNKIKIYACGPTVYNFIHIGNARPLCVFDVLRRFLEYLNYEVKFVQNFTDIDDKIINRANQENISFLEVSEKYIEEFKKDSDGLNVKKSSCNPKATESIKEIIDMISELIKRDFAYIGKSNDVYFRTKKFRNYGKLSKQNLGDLNLGTRIEIVSEKNDYWDFVLWKSSKLNEPKFESPWGLGRPGWHIECSAMIRKHLNYTIDIHCGGQDLIFPHHENEIAQSQCCNDKKLANYWLHNGYINIENKKMSKSLNNFFTVREISKKFGYEPIRYLMISSHYRTPINFSEEIINQCKNSLGKLYNFRENLDFYLENFEDDLDLDMSLGLEKISSFKNKFIKSMEDDLNTSEALAAIFEIVKYVNNNLENKNFSKKFLENTISIFDELTEILGILYNKKNKLNNSKIEDLIKQREKARKNKDWATADKIRAKLKSLDVKLEDTEFGVRIK